MYIERSDTPIYMQIRDQVLRAIAAGILKPGEKMPTTRQVAVALRTDFNTVRHAYDMLAQAGVIAFWPARGMCVAHPTPEPKPADCHVLALATYVSAKAVGRDAKRSPGDLLRVENQRVENQREDGP
jgi:GntR family transcriptional regulator